MRSPGRIHAANPDASKRLSEIRDLLVSRGEVGATTAEILALCPSCAAVSPAISELRERGARIDCKSEGRTADGGNVHRYWWRGAMFPQRLAQQPRLAEIDKDDGPKATPRPWRERLADMGAQGTLPVMADN